CDTKESWENAQEMSIEEILSKVNRKNVIITGGEPSLYDLTDLITGIRQKFSQISHNSVKIAIETNGTRKILWDLDWIVCSPKPDANYQIQCEPDELKYVVDDKFSVDYIPEKYRGKIFIWLQPNAQDLEKSMKKCFKLTMKYDFLRLGIQLHRVFHIK
ncbi:MAG: hypothetical protein ACTSWL_09140, partial [Promethearchaeota archaeon]